MNNKYRHISKNSVKIYELIAVTVFIILTIIPNIIFDFFSAEWNIIIGVILLSYLFTAFFYIPVYCKNIVYSFESENVILKKGIIIKKVKILKYKNIVYMNLVQTPFTPIFKTYTVIMKSPGAFLTINFLDSEQANELLNSFAIRNEVIR